MHTRVAKGEGKLHVFGLSLQLCAVLLVVGLQKQNSLENVDLLGAINNILLASMLARASALYSL